MTTRDIDPNTGLPVLPENERWYVGEVEIDDWGNTAFGVAVIIQYLVPAKTVIDITKRPFAKDIEVERYVPEKWAFDHSNRYTFRNGRSELTPDTIRYAANRILDDREARKNQNALMGVYPPKRLEA